MTDQIMNYRGNVPENVTHRRATVTAMNDTTPPDPRISRFRFPDDFPIDPKWESPVIGSDDDYTHLILRMGMNQRLVMAPKGADGDFGWQYGWCYRSFAAALAAYTAWAPAVQDEPLGWHKRPTYFDVRRAPMRDQDPGYNRPRCVHGCYMHERCDVDGYCEASHESGRREWMEAAGWLPHALGKAAPLPSRTMRRPVLVIGVARET